jgi:hypothetical protein
MKKTAILWDIENVNPKADDSVIAGILESISRDSSVHYAMAAADWTKSTIKSKAAILAANGFELFHLPKSQKDSSDFALTAKGVELAFQIPGLERVILIAGDADFRPLIRTLRKYGIEVRVVCDVANNASEELLTLADEYLDFRDLIPDEDSDDNSKPELTEDQAFELFEDSVRQILSQGKTAAIGHVKVQMRLLNSSFSEQNYACSTMSDFCRKAVANTNVEYQSDQPTNLTLGSDANSSLSKPFQELVECLKVSKEEWTTFQYVGQKIRIEKYGYPKLKNFVLEAEKRGIVEVKTEGLEWSCRLI